MHKTLVFKLKPTKAQQGSLARYLEVTREVLLKREGHAAYLGDYRTWVYACGGLNGSCGHHGAFDTARTLRLPRAAIPEATEQLAAELGLDWYLDREYGTPDTETEAT